MNILKRISIIFILFIIYTFVCAFSYAETVSSDISDTVFRLHIIANSDSKEDQDLKLLVRDNILEYMKQISSNASSKEEIIATINQHINDFHNIAINTIKNEGFDYNVNLKIGNFDFPTKKYGDISLPAGNYDALRIEIGKANGQNWWCMMFPTLCFVDVSSGTLNENSKELLEETLNEEEFSLISENNTEFNFKFKIVEFFQGIKTNLANK